MPDDPDLMAELNAADEAMNGITRVTEWGVRYSNGETHPASSEQMARDWFTYQSGTPNGRKWGVTLVKREVTYSEWQDA